MAPDVKRASDTALGRLAGWCFDHRRKVLLSWIAALVIVGAVAGSFGTAFSDSFGGDNSESGRAQQLLTDRFPAQAGATADVVFHTTGPVGAAENVARIKDLGTKIGKLPGISGVALPDPSNPATAAQVARDGHTAYATVHFTADLENLDKVQIRSVVDTAQAAAEPGFQVELGGAPISYVEQPEMGSSELIGIAAAVVILLVAFGSLIAMGLPILTALFGLGIGISFLGLLSHVMTAPSFAPQMAAMIGLGVGIDYALFIVTRHREVLHRGSDPRAAAVIALATSGRAVLFAGCTVVISLLGMFLLGMPFIYGLAIGAIAAVVLVMLGAVTLLPAMLGFAGHAIDRFGISRFMHRGESDVEHTLSYRWSRVVQHRPWTAVIVSLAILLMLGIPVLSMQQSFTDAGNNPETLTTRRAYDLLAQGFGPGVNGPLIVAVDLAGGADRSVATKLSQHLGAATADGVAFASPPQFNPKGDTATIVVIPKTSPQDPKTQTLVAKLRNDVVPEVMEGTHADALVGGFTAMSVDASRHLSKRLPYVIGGVVVLSFLLLMAVFRSVAVPLKAAVMNLLSIGAAYGVIVAIFQWGWLGGLVGIGHTGPIEPWIPLMLFTILFGLSMDYEVFLLSRVRENWLHTGDNATSVADGLAGTARVITAAAAIMVCVFGSFVLGDLRVLKLFGLGLAVAVFIDASVVRMVLVPATMELLGKANWWLPGWLDRIVPSLAVEVDLAEDHHRAGTRTDTAEDGPATA